MLTTAGLTQAPQHHPPPLLLCPWPQDLGSKTGFSGDPTWQGHQHALVGVRARIADPCPTWPHLLLDMGRPTSTVFCTPVPLQVLAATVTTHLIVK